MHDRNDPRVLFPFVGDSVGGSHLSALTLMRHLDQHGYDPVIVLHGRGPLSKHLDAQGIEWIPAPARIVSNAPLPRQLGAMLACAPSLAWFLRRQSAAIVHTNDLRMHMTWAAPGRLVGAAHVWHQRTADPSRRNAVYSRLSPAVVTISHYCCGQFPRTMGARTQVIDNPVEPEAGDMTPHAARAALVETFGAAPDVRIVGFVGALNEQKRPLDFVDIARGVQSGLSAPVVFPMFGKTGPLDAAVSGTISTAGMEASLRWLGLRYPLQPWLAACDVLVAPAVNEGLGRAVIEAMIAGTPVVARKSGGHEELIADGETGLFPAAEDTPGFAAAVIALLEDRQRAKALAARARREALDRFEPRQHARRIAAVYNTLLGRMSR